MSNNKKKATPVDVKPRRDPWASLKMADLMISKPKLPAVLLEQIVDRLDVPDLIRCARVSRRLHEMVYDDTRWNKRLRRMGCWDETEARKWTESQREMSGVSEAPRRKATIDHTIVNGKGRPEIVINGFTTPRQSISHNDSPSSLIPPIGSPLRNADGFQNVNLTQIEAPRPDTKPSHTAALSILKSARSIRGKSRQEYGKVYRVLAPFYRDITSNSSNTSLLFRTFSRPEDQAQLLVQLKAFATSDFSPGAAERAERIQDVIDRFDTAALLEFRQGYEYKDIQGRMRQYAHVMHTLSGGKISADLFLNDNRLIAQQSSLGSVSDCIDYSLGYGQLSLERVQAYFERLGNAYAQEAAIIQTVFPEPEAVLLLFLEKVAAQILSPFLTALFEDARMRSASTYLRVISGTFAATKQFIITYTLPNQADEKAITRTNEVMIQIYGPHMEAYLSEEYNFFKQKADKEIQQWDQALIDQDTTTETFLMSNVNRQAVKKDFMSSFKQVLMAPVNILPKIPSIKTKSSTNGEPNLTASPYTTRPTTPSLTALVRTNTPTFPNEAPTSELAAKAAIMENRLESIKSLFSVEIALNLVHAAKSSMERAAQFISLKGEVGEKARQECSNMFVLLLNTIGTRHVKSGFDKAIDHLSSYSARNANTSNNPQSDSQQQQQPTVAPLTTFLELVNVGDLIQQMLDVFFESEIVAHGISRRDDFLDVPVKEKRKFEAMLDERVAAGLSKGIDVLMDEVEYICATEQSPTDYNPALFDATVIDHHNPSSHNTNSANNHSTTPSASMMAIPDIDISPTPTTKKLITLISTYHSLLLGSTDKTLLDVFTSELGLRLFTSLTKHIRRQRISPLGAMRLLTDLSSISTFVATTFKNAELNGYFIGLREVAQLYLFECKSEEEIEEMCGLISDRGRYGGVFGTEEVVEFVERRTDWIGIRGRVEGKVKGEGCVLM